MMTHMKGVQGGILKQPNHTVPCLAQGAALILCVPFCLDNVLQKQLQAH